MTVSLICFAIAALCYVVSQLQQHGKLVWSNPVRPFGFWGEDSHRRKYKRVEGGGTFAYRITGAPNTWYYNLFNINYRERFPLSTTLLVFVTDGYHFMQWLMKIWLALAFVPFVGWWWSLGYWAVFTVVFATGYKFMQR